MKTKIKHKRFLTQLAVTEQIIDIQKLYKCYNFRKNEPFEHLKSSSYYRKSRQFRLRFQLFTYLFFSKVIIKIKYIFFLTGICKNIL